MSIVARDERGAEFVVNEQSDAAKQNGE